MAQYLVECDCGRKVPVEIGQAGGRVSCSCGAVVDVPQLRKLRHLPVAAKDEEVAPKHWSARHGLIAASLIVTAVLVIINFWSWYTQPVIPEFNPELYASDVERRLTSMTPAESWLWWIEYYHTLGERGLPVLSLSNRAELEKQIAHRKSTRQNLWIAAAISAAIAGIAAVWLRAEKRRRS